jgi:hypothetical protein
MFLFLSFAVLLSNNCALKLYSFPRLYFQQVIDYSLIMRSNGNGNEDRASLIRKMWRDRIRGTKRNVEVKRP